MLSLVSFLTLLLTATLQLGVHARSAGCGKAPPSTGTRSINGRQYILTLPDNYDRNREHMLIFGFHWRGGTMQDVATGQTVNRDLWQYYGLKRLAGNNAIFVAPQGNGNGWGNGGGSDVNFVDSIIRSVENELCVDESQRFATGFSFGGGMSNALACARPNLFRAVAVIAGAQLSGCDGGTQPIAYLGMHGIADGVLGIASGRSLRDRFLRNNGCQSKNAPEPARGSRTHIKTEYSCRAGYPVTWIAFDGDHDASPADNTSGSTPASEKGRLTWAPGETWAFFRQFGGGGSPSPPSPPTPPTPPPTGNPTTPPPSGCAARWGQCGGSGYSGPTCCQAGSTCQRQNEWYSQCL